MKPFRRKQAALQSSLSPVSGPAASALAQLQFNPPDRPPSLPTIRLPETGFVRLPVVLQVFPVSRSAWWEGIRKKRYPQGVKLGPRITAWRVEDIRKLIDEAH